jgi:hypothetical protein
MASTVRSHRADRGSIPRVGVFYLFLQNFRACMHIRFDNFHDQLIRFIRVYIYVYVVHVLDSEI